MTRRDPTIMDLAADLFKIAPSWVGPVVAAGTFLIFWISSAFLPENQFFPVTPIFQFLAFLTAGMLLFLWIIIELGKLLSRARYFRQTSIHSIRQLSWRQFEELIAEHYRQQGCHATVTGNATGDGGIDVELISPSGQRIIVQCKHWKTYRVGVRPARELLGILTAEKARKAILITSGTFTPAAQRFASRNPALQLINGTQLAQMLPNVASTSPPRMEYRLQSAVPSASSPMSPRPQSDPHSSPRQSPPCPSATPP